MKSNTLNVTPSKSPKDMNGDFGLDNALNNFDNNNNMSVYGDLFSPSILASVSPSNSNDYLSFAQANQPLQQGQQQNTAQPSTNQNISTSRLNSESSIASPESSTSNYGITSSYVTTPESSADSPGHQKSAEAGGPERRRSKIGTHEEFNKEIQTACGNKDNPIPPALSTPGTAPAIASSQPKTPGLDFQGFDWLAAQNGGAFDPILFGDYRDPQDNIMGSGLNNFFNEAFPASDLSSGLNQSLDPPPPKKKDLMRTIEERQAGNELEVVPGEPSQRFLTCNLLW